MHAAAFLASLIGAPLVYAVGVVSIPLLAKGTLAFVPAMLAGIALARVMRRMRFAKIIGKVQCSVESADY